MSFSQAHTWIENLIYETVGGSRFTQRSPAMPEVWRTYGVHGPGPQDLLMITNWRQPTRITLADSLARRLGFGKNKQDAEDACAEARLAPTQSAVVAELDFRAFLRAALPLSPWWHRYLIPERQYADGTHGVEEPSRFFRSPEAFRPLRAALRTELLKVLRSPLPATNNADSSAPLERVRVMGDFVWLTRVVGGLWMLFRDHFPNGLDRVDLVRLEKWEEQRRQPDLLLDALLEVFAEVPPPDAEEPLWSIHQNRRAAVSMRESTATAKADAARKLFGVTGRGIRWAVIDTGIDATHLAFQRRNSRSHRNGNGGPDKRESKPPANAETSRIVATYEFTNLRELMAIAPRHLEALSVQQDSEAKRQLPEKVAARLPESLRTKIETDSEFREALLLALKRTRGQFHNAVDGKAELVPAGRTIDWEAWEPMLVIGHDPAHYSVPHHKHGTHVAGILAADWRAEDRKDDLVVAELGQPRRLVDRTGVCPEIELYDFRALKEDGTADEFSVLVALQFVRALNARHEHVQIHGVNLSLSLSHDVSNYACGQTPVCEECERLVGSGVVVVAAAGNNGMARYATTEGKYEEGYRTVSITDPGNAQSVITVGATHRSEPHTYGVSYFSSRGPTGDGRMKPDLVAPGEKVTSTIPGNSEESLDGTSMAAPHVSGAAALLFCRYAELKGRPAEVKRILCESATDLGRERSFQGAGLLDILRAMEAF